MCRELFFENRRKLMKSAGILSLLIIGYLIWTSIVYINTDRNDRMVEEELAKVSYTEDFARSEMEALQPYTELSFMSASIRGQLYRAMAELSYMAGDDMEYNNYIACAFHYLQSAGNTDAVVYLSNKYIGRLYANGCYASAEELLNNMAADYNIEKLAVEEQTSYYLSAADIAEMQDKEASIFLQSASDAISRMPDGGTKQLNQAKLDLLSARNDIKNGDFEQAETRISEYTAEEHFGLGANQVYVICDFRIPYYEMMAKIELQKGNTVEAYEYVDKYLKLCDSFQFRAMKLRLLQYVVAHQNTRHRTSENPYIELEASVFEQNLNDMTMEYGLFLSSDIKNTREELERSEQKQETVKRSLIFVMILLGSTAVFYCVISILVDYNGKDGLTRLNSRAKYEKVNKACQRKGTPYCMLMIDIDDFKKVNDTYGHARGDVVLKEISSILKQYAGPHISAYRYGGEEMCLFFFHVSEKSTRQIAEEIRNRIELNVCVEDRHITISGGIGVSRNGENVFEQADRRLYEAKKQGKNRII